MVETIFFASNRYCTRFRRMTKLPMAAPRVPEIMAAVFDGVHDFDWTDLIRGYLVRGYFGPE